MVYDDCLRKTVKQQKAISSPTHCILKVVSMKRCVCNNFLWVNISVHFFRYCNVQEVYSEHSEQSSHGAG